MKKSIAVLSLIIFALSPVLRAQEKIPVPTPQQAAWHEMEFYIFTHFGPNTFTDKEWGLGDEPEDVFNPTGLDCRQWCRIAKAAGAKGIIITAKHHDGFCLWPSKYSTHTVRESSWKGGKGDVLKELSQACKQYGLKFGVYLSPWDRNHPKYGTDEYNGVFVNMMKEVFTNYGPIWEFWWDGANGEGPNGKKQVYDWNRFEKTIHDLSPNTIVFSDIGPHIRWVGNEQGFAGKTNWNTLDTAGFTRGLGAPATDTLNSGNVQGKSWIPAECDVSIRPGWFNHAEEDEKVKTPEQLFDLYLKSVGRGANLLLNVPPDRQGLINEQDSASLIGFARLRNSNLRTNLAKTATTYANAGEHAQQSKLNDTNLNTYETASGSSNHLMGLQFARPKKINCIVLREFLQKGQHCKKFTLSLMNKKQQVSKTIEGTTIGRKRIITFPAVETEVIALATEGQNGASAISEMEVYLIDDNLVER